jgi:major vault protein
LAAIEANKFRSIVKAIGAETLQAIAQAGPEVQAQMLAGLGVQDFLVADGASPLSVFTQHQSSLSLTS